MPISEPAIAAFLQVLQQLGWTDGRNVRIDTRWAGGHAADIRKYAADLVALAPDVIVATGTAAMAPLMQATRTVPIVFANVADPVGAGFVDSHGAAGRQRHRLYSIRIQLEREMAGTAQADRARHDAGRSSSGSRHTLRDRTIRRNPVRGAIARGGGDRGQRARRRRDRARRHGLCALLEWRSDLDGKRVGGGPSRTDHRARGPVQTACGLLPTLLCRQRWLDLLWVQMLFDHYRARRRLCRPHPQGWHSASPCRQHCSPAPTR